MQNPRRARFIAYFQGGPLKGSREKLMQRTGLTKGRVSQLFDEGQPFGELAARNLAEKLGLAPDHFERDQDMATPEVATDLEVTALLALRDIQRINPETHAQLISRILEIADGLRATDSLLRTTHGVKSYVTSHRAAETLPSAGIKRDASQPVDNLVDTGMSGFGELEEAERKAGKK